MPRNTRHARSLDPTTALTFLAIALAALLLALTPKPAPATGPEILFDNTTDQPAQSVPRAPTQFRLHESRRISAIRTYHWNDGRGATPGSIALEGPGKRMFGPWQAEGRPGRDGVADVYWEVRPDIVLEPGLYTVLDSDPGSWSRNAGQRSEGIARVLAWPPAASAGSGAERAAAGSGAPAAARDAAPAALDAQPGQATDGGLAQAATDPPETAAANPPPTTPADLLDEERSRELLSRFDPLPPLSRLLGDARASAVAPRLDPGEFSRLQYLGAVSAVKQAMSEVLGPMSPSAAREFGARWDAIYEYPADAAVDYLNAAAPILGEILSLRATLAKTMQAYDNFINQAQLAQFVGAPEAAHELMGQAGRTAALLKALERGLSDAVGRLAALGELPDVSAIKQNAAQDYRRARNLLKELSGPQELSGEYEPAPYQSVQNPWHLSRDTPETGLIRTEPSDYDVTTYLEPLKSLGEDRVLVYLCETDADGEKSSTLQLFERTADGSLVGYTGGSELTRIVIQPTEDGFRKIESSIGPREFSEDVNEFSEQVVGWLAQGRVPDIDLVWDVRVRNFEATHVQYQARPTDDEFDWSNWETLVRKHQREILAEFEGERSAFAALAERVTLAEPVPAEHLYWVLEDVEPFNRHPTAQNDMALFVLDAEMEATYAAMMGQREYHVPRPMMRHARRTSVSTSGLENTDRRQVYDDSFNKGKPVDTLHIDHRVDWTVETPVVAQAGGDLVVEIATEREVSRPAQAVLLPSPFPDLVAVLTPQALEPDRRYKGYAGDSVQSGLLTEHLAAGPGRVRQVSRVRLPFDKFSSDTGAVVLTLGDSTLGSLSSLSGAGVKLHFSRRVMTPEAAAELADTMRGDLEQLARADRDSREARQRDIARAEEEARLAQEAAEATRAFHEATVDYEQHKAAQFGAELEALTEEIRKSGKPPSEEQQKRIAALRFNVISAQSNAIAEQDRIRELETGRYERSETPFDTFARAQFRRNIERNITRLEALETQHSLAEKYISFLPEEERRQARQTLYDIAPDDLDKYRKLNAALKSKWQGHSEARLAVLDEDLAWKEAQVEALENIKTGADAALLATSMMGGPQAIALTYQFATGWAEKDLLTGVKQSVSMYSDAVDIAWSTYDGYQQGGWAGAAKAGGMSLALNKGLPFLLGKLGKQGDLPDDLPGGRIAKEADGLGSAARQADTGTPTRLLDARRVDDVASYKAELEQAEQQVKTFVSDYHAWRKGVKAGLPDDEVRALHRKVVDSTAAINQNPTAKGYLKYKAPPATGRFFDKSLDDLHAQARARYYRTMREAGYSEHEIFAIRNAASSGSTGMDFDQALKEQPDYLPFRNSDGSVSLRRNHWLTKNGESVSRHQWQKDAQEAWNNAYREVSGGYSAPRSWEKMTTRIDPEAYRLMSVLDIRKDLGNIEEIMDGLDPKWVRQMSDVTLFKAGEMLSDPNLSRLAGVREACRGTAKDLDGKFLPFIETRLAQLKRTDPSKLTASDRHNLDRLESALSTFTRVRDSFDAIGKADLPPERWDDAIRQATGGKGIMQTIEDLGDLTQSLFM